LSIPRPVTGVRALKLRSGHATELPEHLATESPMQILVAGPGEVATPLAVTMRTPGHDFELAAGFVVSEGVVPQSSIRSVAYCDDPSILMSNGSATPAALDELRFNHVTVRVTTPNAVDRLERRFGVSSSCGVCGKTSIDQVELSCTPLGKSEALSPQVIWELPDALRAAQVAFERTGGLHAAGLFDAAGRVCCVREDVGRHNAVDKVVGHLALAGSATTGGESGHQPRPGDPALAGWVLLVSGRVSFEIVQKAAMAGIGTIAAISAPSSLAVEAADRLGVAVIGFLRGQTFNVYSHRERIETTT
jgi:FdhD protein